MEYVWMFLLLQAVAIESIHSISPVCDVYVPDPPWLAEYLFVPAQATIYINCTTDSDSNYSPLWLIDLANDTIDTAIPFDGRREVINDHGVYELEPIKTPGMPPTLRLLINDTARNNGTEIKCVGENDFKMTLITFDPIEFTLKESGMDLNSINISWNQLLSASPVTHSENTVLPKFSLKINNRSHDEVIVLNKTHYTFTVPQDVPPCEVYNFSVTATYVGATYTGVGCSVPSPVLSRMLPSLPDIEKLVSSLNYTLHMVRLPQNKELTTVSPFLTISFEAAKCCDQYPVSNYTIEMTDLSSQATVPMSTTISKEKNMIFVHSNDLTENAAYSFIVTVSNVWGSVSTNIKTLYTTDVQKVAVILLKKMNAVKVQCDFVTGSKAQGCMVVLVGEFGNITVKTERNNACTIEFLNASIKVENYHEAVGFDIESDGTIGSMAIPGELRISDASHQSHTLDLCNHRSNTLTTNTQQDLIVQVVSISVPAILIAIVIITIIIALLCCKIRRTKYYSKSCVESSRDPSLRTNHHSDREFQEESAEALYDEPHKYYVLERDSTIPDSQPQATNPIYHEITELPITISRPNASSQFKLDTESPLPSMYSTIAPHPEETFV